MKEECYDYFESNDQDDEEPVKEPDVTWDVDDDVSTPAIDTSDDDKQEEEETVLQQENTPSVETSEEPREPKGFWEKVKNILKG